MWIDRLRSGRRGVGWLCRFGEPIRGTGRRRETSGKHSASASARGSERTHGRGRSGVPSPPRSRPASPEQARRASPAGQLQHTTAEFTCSSKGSDSGERTPSSPVGGVMDRANKKRPRHLCVLCVRVRTAARARAMRGGALHVLACCVWCVLYARASSQAPVPEPQR